MCFFTKDNSNNSSSFFSVSLIDFIYRTLWVDPEILDFQHSLSSSNENRLMDNSRGNEQSGVPGPCPTVRENWTAADFFVMNPTAPLHNVLETNWQSPISTAAPSNYDDLDGIQPASFNFGAAYEALLGNVLSPPSNTENTSYGHTVKGNHQIKKHLSSQNGCGLKSPLQPPISLSTSFSMPSKNTVAAVVHSCRCSVASNDEHLQQAIQIMGQPVPIDTNIKPIILELFKTLGNLGMEKFSSRLLKIPYLGFRFEMKSDMPFERFYNREDTVRVISNFSKLPRCMRNQLLRQSDCISTSVHDLSIANLKDKNKNRGSQ
ncbi:unnamed protein product [Caenorhabditis nigoni]